MSKRSVASAVSRYLSRRSSAASDAQSEGSIDEHQPLHSPRRSSGGSLSNARRISPLNIFDSEAETDLLRRASTFAISEGGRRNSRKEGRASTLKNGLGMEAGLLVGPPKGKARGSILGGVKLPALDDPVCEAGDPKGKTAKKGKSFVLDVETASNCRTQVRGRMQRMQARSQRKREDNLQDKRFNALPQDERESMHRVFLRFDVYSSGSLDFPEVTSCLRDLGLAGTNSNEKREISRICRDVAAVANVTHSAVMNHRTKSDQHFTQAQSQGKIIRQKQRLEMKRQRAAQRQRRGSEQSAAKAAASGDPSAEPKTLNPFAAIAAAVEKVADETDGPQVKDELAKAKSEDRAKHDVKSPSSTRGDLTNRGEGRNSATGDEASAISGSDSELLSSSASQNSGSELVEQRTASDDDLDSDFKFDFLTFALMVVPQVRQRLTDLQSNKMLRYFCHFDRAGQGKLTIPQCLEVGRCIGIDQHGFMQALESKGNGADTLVEFDAFASSIFKSREQAERLARERELQIRDLTGIDHVLFGEFRLIIIQLHEVFMNLSEEVGSVGTTAVRVLTYANCLGAVREQRP
ncbi:unnamed protein product [Polarella glacialis]|uniref:EF-hand domain-containing protein n=1 Tax=Polarella glacialis TaxID=89957 RepID=A0A813GH85_POLGL|nr:unnamed protein product [Polarella glacialis]